MSYRGRAQHSRGGGGHGNYDQNSSQYAQHVSGHTGVGTAACRGTPRSVHIAPLMKSVSTVESFVRVTCDDVRPRNRNRGNRGRSRFNKGRGGPGGFDRPNPLSRLEDEGDAQMDGGPPPPQGRYNPYGGRRPRQDQYHTQRGGRNNSRYNNRGQRGSSSYQRLGLPIGGGGGRGRGYYQGGGDRRHDEQWFRVEVMEAAEMNQGELLSQIQTQTNTPFIPTHYHHIGQDAIFYIQTHRLAEAIKRASNRITLSNGRKVIVTVKVDKNPNTKALNDDCIQKLKICMSSRYNTDHQALNLSDLYNDHDMKSATYQLALTSKPVMDEVVKIIEEHIPEVRAVDLSNNGLNTLRLFASIAKKTPDLVKLDVSNNRLKSAEDMLHLKDWKIIALDVRENDFCRQFNNDDDLASAIRKHIPTLKILNGTELPPQITFALDTSTTSSLPETKGSSFRNDPIKEVIGKFLQEYYEIFDSDSRQGLLDAYHEDASFSWTFFFNNLKPQKHPRWGDMYEGRNLSCVKDPDKRKKTLKKGKLQIVAALDTLPSTTHDPKSFTIDVMFTSNALLVFSVNGVFKEGDDSKNTRPVINAFSRVFVTVPHGSGIVITNDMLSVYPACPEETKNAFKNPAPTPASSPTPGVSSPQTSEQAAQAEKQAILARFCQASGMNTEFSIKCLEQNNWDFAKSGQIFQELQASGKIPPEAFVK